MFRALLVLLFLSASLCAKEWRIGRDPSWYPGDFMGKEPSLTAFTDALLQAFAKEEGASLVIVSTHWNTLLPSLEDDLDGVCILLEPTEALRNKYCFSDPYLPIGPVLLVRAESPLPPAGEVLPSLSGKLVGIPAGSDYALLLQKNPQIFIRLYDSPAVGLEALARGELDGFLLDNLIAESYVRDLYRGQLSIATPPLVEGGLRLVALKKEKRLVKAFNKALLKLEKEGVLEKQRLAWIAQCDSSPPVHDGERLSPSPPHPPQRGPDPLQESAPAAARR